MASRAPVSDPSAYSFRIPRSYAELPGIRDPYARYLSIPDQYVTHEGTAAQFINTYPLGE